MTEGTISDIDGDDTVMDGADVTVSIDLSKLPQEQALALAREAGLEDQDEYIIGRLVKGEADEQDMNHLNDAEFHLPLGPGLTLLAQMGVIELPEQPPTSPEDVEVAE